MMDNTAAASSERKFSLQKHERDLIAHTRIIAFKPLVGEMAPEFCENVLSEHNLSIMEEEYLEIVQHLVDQLIYRDHADKYWRNYHSSLKILYILGLSCHDGKYFTSLKQDLLNHVTKNITVKNLVSIFEKIERFQQNFIENFNATNYLLEILHNYCIEFTVVAFEHPKVGCSKKLLDSPIIIRNYSKIVAKVNLTKPSQIKLSANINLPSTVLQALKKLYNDESTSDVKISIGLSNNIYCHKTILASSSSFFRIWFEKTDSSVYHPGKDVDLELFQILAKCCYNIMTIDIDNKKITRLVDMCMNHNMDFVVDFYHSIVPYNKLRDSIKTRKK